MHTTRLVTGLSAAALLAGVLACAPAAAQEKKITLRLADSFPAQHYLHRYATRPWMEQVTRATNGEVVFEHYPSEQMGKSKDLLSLVQSGAVDGSLFVVSYAADKLPLAAAMELPGMFGNSCQATLAHWKLAKDGGALAQAEYGPAGVHVLFTPTPPPYQLAVAEKKVESVKDLDGLKVRVVGGSMELTMKKLKSVGVRMSAPDTFEAVNRGTIDGALFAYGSLLQYKIPAKHVTTGAGFGSVALIFIINQNKWKSLPENVKAIMSATGEAVNKSSCAAMDADEAGDLQKLKQQGTIDVRWTAEDKKRIEEVTASVANEWAAELDRRGKPGSRVLKAALAARE